MKYNYKGMDILIEADYDNASKKAAWIVASQITLNPRSVLGLATGSTPEGMYDYLVKMYQKGDIDFSEVVTFNLDEYYNLGVDHYQSYHYYMNEHLFDFININKDNVYIPNGTADDVEEYCLSYDKAIKDYGNIDLQILGIGNNGHIGFNEPDVYFELGTHLVELDEDTIKANSRFFNRYEDVPKRALSMGIRNIMHSKKIVLLAMGENKSKIVREMIMGKVTSKVPASILQLHANVTVILDQLAAEDIIDELK